MMTDAIQARAADVQNLLAELVKAIAHHDPAPMQAARLLVELDRVHTDLARVAAPIIEARD